ncbi:MAG: hypothetical protein ACOVNL_14425 [Prochlorococcaceae cyanobacterium]
MALLAQLFNPAMLLKFRRIVGLHSYKLATHLEGAAALLLLCSGQWAGSVIWPSTGSWWPAARNC